MVGGDRAYPPYEFVNENGWPSGFNVELTQAIAEVMGMRVEIRLGAWSDMRLALDDGTIDVLQGISYSAERAQLVDFSPPFAIVHHSIHTRKDTPVVSSVQELTRTLSPWPETFIPGNTVTRSRREIRRCRRALPKGWRSWKKPDATKKFIANGSG
jgi:ABC-type amino acid transport substrate-binding protein